MERVTLSARTMIKIDARRANAEEPPSAQQRQQQMRAMQETALHARSISVGNTLAAAVERCTLAHVGSAHGSAAHSARGCTTVSRWEARATSRQCRREVDGWVGVATARPVTITGRT